jgi:hypothetical protein
MINIPPALCLQCRASKYLCGLAYCPLIARFNIANINTSNNIEGSTPPSVFVGRMGYPKVNVGLLITPIDDNSNIYDKPELWYNLKLDDILKFRLSLVRGNITYNINNAKEPDNKLLKLQEIAISNDAIDAKMRIEKIKSKAYLSENIAPFGPSGRLISFNTGNTKVNNKIENVWYDKDLNANDAIIKLYNDNIPLSSIIKAFSIGVLGKKRRLVPTRWSITAVDDIISRALINNIKNNSVIDEYQVFVRKILLNTFVAILIPKIWQFEWIEAWFPKTTWNMLEYGEPEILGDYEDYNGLDHYARVGGCYYSARVAIVEYLNNIRKSAGVLILREIYPGFNIPIGVWFVREQLRAMFRSKPIKFDSIDNAINYVMSNLTIPLYKWREKSIILKGLKQKSILEYFINK